MQTEKIDTRYLFLLLGAFIVVTIISHSICSHTQRNEVFE